MLGDLPAHLPVAPECSAVFEPKLHDPHAPPSLFTGYYPEQFFFVSPDEKSPQREKFCQCGRGETKMAEALKGIKINEFTHGSEQWKHISIGTSHQMSTVKVTGV